MRARARQIFGIGCLLASLVGVLLVASAVKRSGKASIVVFLLAFVCPARAFTSSCFAKPCASPRNAPLFPQTCFAVVRGFLSSVQRVHQRKHPLFTLHQLQHGQTGRALSCRRRSLALARCSPRFSAAATPAWCGPVPASRTSAKPQTLHVLKHFSGSASPGRCCFSQHACGDVPLRACNLKPPQNVQGVLACYSDARRDVVACAGPGDPHKHGLWKLLRAGHQVSAL